MKEYLLGILDEEAAGRVEVRYFCDPQFFEWMKELEERMIIDYLQGGLSALERERFESRYKVVPLLKQRLQEVQSKMGQEPRSIKVRWQYVLAGITLILCGLAPWLLLRRGSGPAEAPSQPSHAPGTLMVFRLTPGVEKSAAARQVEFTLPSAGRIGFSLELPGRTAPLDCSVVLTVAGSEGRRTAVWQSPQLRSEAEGSGQAVRIELDAAAVSPNDYIGEIRTLSGEIVETYPFRLGR